MIKITKPAKVPAVLAKKGKEATEILTKDYLQFEKEYQSGSRKFEFDRKIYAHKTVKKALLKAQHDKCCFCEQKIEDDNDVEHFRPKGGYQQNEKEYLQKPGYYWLVYDWENLFYACSKCNTSFKRNFFPLVDTSKRAKSHLADIQQEEPLFIHPAKENPENFIEFVADQPRAINGNKRGQVTIKRTGIDRPFLNIARYEYYRKLKFIYEVAQNPSLESSLKMQIRNVLDKAIQDNAEYAAMIRCAIKHQFRF